MSAAVIGRQLRQQQSSARVAGPVVPPTQYKGRGCPPMYGGDKHHHGGVQASPGSSTHSYVPCPCRACQLDHTGHHLSHAPSSGSVLSSASLHGQLVRCLHSNQHPNQHHTHQNQPSSHSHSHSHSRTMYEHDSLILHNSHPPLPTIDIADTSIDPDYHLSHHHNTFNFDPYDHNNSYNSTTNNHNLPTSPYNNHSRYNSGADANKKFAQFSALYTHHEFYPHPAHRESAKDGGARRQNSKDKKKSDDENKRFHCTTHCCCVALKALSAGILLLLLGTAMTLLGFFSERISDPDKDELGEESAKTHLHNLTYVGPVVMGLGGIVLVAACVLTFEVRDTLGTKRRHDPTDPENFVPVDPEAPGSGSYLQVPEEFLRKPLKVPHHQQPLKESPSQQSINEHKGNFGSTHGEPNHTNKHVNGKSNSPPITKVFTTDDPSQEPRITDPSKTDTNRDKPKENGHLKTANSHPHKDKRRHTHKHRSKKKTCTVHKQSTKAQDVNKTIALHQRLYPTRSTSGLWIPSPAETDFSDLDGCSLNPSPAHQPPAYPSVAMSHRLAPYLSSAFISQLPSRDAKILASVESDGLSEPPMSGCSSCERLPATNSGDSGTATPPDPSDTNCSKGALLDYVNTRSDTTNITNITNNQQHSRHSVVGNGVAKTTNGLLQVT